MDNRMHILLDADSVYFKICVMTKKKHEIRKSIDRKLNDIIRNAGLMAEDVQLMVAVKGPNNFRFSVYDEYKGVRPPLEDDMKEALNYANDYLIEKHGAVRATGAEADDLVCVWAHECWSAGLTYIVAHIDKDLNMIPGPHYNFDKQDIYYVEPDEGFRYFMHQCLTGDRADHIPGIKGIGPKKADKLLDGVQPKNMWKVVKQAWAEAGYSKIELIRSMRMLWMSICREDVVSANLDVLARLEGNFEDFWEAEDTFAHHELEVDDDTNS